MYYVEVTMICLLYAYTAQIKHKVRDQSFFCTRFKVGIRPGIACTCAAVEVHMHCDTPTQHLPITPTGVGVCMIKY